MGSEVGRSVHNYGISDTCRWIQRIGEERRGEDRIGEEKRGEESSKGTSKVTETCQVIMFPYPTPYPMAAKIAALLRGCIIEQFGHLGDKITGKWIVNCVFFVTLLSTVNILYLLSHQIREPGLAWPSFSLACFSKPTTSWTDHEKQFCDSLS